MLSLIHSYIVIALMLHALTIQVAGSLLVCAAMRSVSGTEYLRSSSPLLTAGSTAISWASSALPNDTVLIQGLGLASVDSAVVRYVNQAGSTRSAELPLAITPSPDGTSAAVTLPNEANGGFTASQYYVELRSGNLTAATVLINEPELWWAAGETRWIHRSINPSACR